MDSHYEVILFHIRYMLGLEIDCCEVGMDHERRNLCVY